MVTIRFELNGENIRKYVNIEAGVEKFRDILRRMYVEDMKAEEIAPLVYRRDDENVMCDFGRHYRRDKGLYAEVSGKVTKTDEGDQPLILRL